MSDRIRAEIAGASRLEFPPGVTGGLGYVWKLPHWAKRPNVALIWLILQDSISGLVKADRMLDSKIVEGELPELILTLEIEV
jgi:hypothetical protein